MMADLTTNAVMRLNLGQRSAKHRLVVHVLRVEIDLRPSNMPMDRRVLMAVGDGIDATVVRLASSLQPLVDQGVLDHWCIVPIRTPPGSALFQSEVPLVTKIGPVAQAPKQYGHAHTREKLDVMFQEARDLLNYGELCLIPPSGLTATFLSSLFRLPSILDRVQEPVVQIVTEGRLHTARNQVYFIICDGVSKCLASFYADGPLARLRPTALRF